MMACAEDSFDTAASIAKAALSASLKRSILRNAELVQHTGVEREGHVKAARRGECPLHATVPDDARKATRKGTLGIERHPITLFAWGVRGQVGDDLSGFAGLGGDEHRPSAPRDRRVQHFGNRQRCRIDAGIAVAGLRDAVHGVRPAHAEEDQPAGPPGGYCETCGNFAGAGERLARVATLAVHFVEDRTERGSRRSRQPLSI